MSESPSSKTKKTVSSPPNASLSDIIKVCMVDSTGKKTKIFVFGNNATNGYTKEELFSDLELTEFELDNTDIRFSTQQIHIDDSIRTIKKKLIIELGTQTVCYDEMYMFSIIETKVDSLSTYLQLVDDIEQPITKPVFGQLIMNLENPYSTSKCKEKDLQNHYYYHDIRECLDQNIFLKIPLGQRFSNTRDLLFSANPFDVLPHSPPIFIPHSKNPLLSFENLLLLNYGKIHRNTIYLCLAGDMYEYATKNNIEQEYITQLYYPLLSRRGITTQDLFQEKKQVLIDENKKIINPRNKRLYDTIQHFYNIHYGRNRELTYSERGIKYFDITIHPNHNMTIPLDVLFKKLNASQNMPFIKYNPGIRRENIYRLFTTNVTRTGKKIPYLPKNKILQYSRQIGKSRQLSVFMFSNGSDIFIDFNHNGDINIRSLLNNSISKDDLVLLIQTLLNPIVENINDFLLPTGNFLPVFNDFDDEFVEIVDLKLVMQIQLPGTMNLNLTANSGCLTSIFNIDDSNLSRGAILQFKRVENFKKMEMIDINITDLFNNNKNEYDVIQYLMQNYDFSQEVAMNHLSEYLKSHSRVEGRFINKSIEIVENPGFPTLFRLTSLDNRLYIEMNKINSIQYIDTICLYIDSFLRMIHYPDSTSVDVKCLKKQKDDAVDDDISHISNVVTTTQLAFVINDSVAVPYGEGEGEGEGYGEDYDEGIIFDDEEDEDVDAIIFEEDEDEDDQNNEYESNNIVEEEENLESSKPLEKPLEIPEFSEDIVVKNAEESIDREPIEESNEDDDDDEEDDAIIWYSTDSDEEDEKDEKDENDEEDDDENPNKKGGKIPSTLYGGVGEHLDGQPFKKKELTYDKMARLDPKLFVIPSNDKYSGYTSVCQANTNLQPVILTKEEKERIDREHPGSYEHALEYGSDPNNKNFFICPRYWCLLTNSSITEEEVKAGKCGKVIPPGSDTIPPGHYVYEFTDKKYHIDKDGNYKTHNPGLKDSKNHPDGLCLPCCVSNWNAPGQEKRRQQCLANSTEENIGDDDALQNIDYVIGAQRFPIPTQRLGFLPPSIEIFLGIDHKNAVTKKNAALIKPNTPILLRRGVEQSNKQSFIACIADIYAARSSEKRKKKKDTQEGATVTPTIKEMRDIIADAVSLDQYIQYHNGSLVRVFQPRKTWVDTADMQKYSETAFYKTIDFNNDAQVDFFEDTIASYENFLQFLRDDDSKIDYTYLWDIITSKNPKLFMGGINLVILNILDNDITDNMEIICPNTTYSSNLFDINKETVILLKRDDLYEPIYLYEDKGTVKQITKTFNKASSTKNIQHVMQIINTSTNKYCSPLPSMPKIYKFKRNIPIHTIVDFLQEKEDLFEIGSQIMNYQGKIVGITVKIKTEDVDAPFIYVPCYPSPKIPEIPVEYIEGGFWKDYQTTRDILLDISTKSDGKVLSKPKMKVIDKGLIVGILTETNQFVQTIPPSENVFDDGLDEMNDTNYILADKVLTTSKKMDAELSKTIRNISLENQFYSAFRTTLRLALNHPSNTLVRKDFLRWIDSSRLYKDKLKAVDILLRKLLKKWVVFADIQDDVLNSFDEVTNCLKNSKNKKFCLTKGIKTGNDDLGSLIIPKKHLISGIDNETVYFGRMADELVRYKRIRTLLFQPRINVNIGDVEYKLQDNEMILLDSLMTPEYFDDMTPFLNITDRNAKNIDYYYSQPEVTQKYGMVVTTNEQVNVENTVDIREKMAIKCIKGERDIVGNVADNIWKRILPKTAKEQVLDKTPLCTFFLLIQLFYQKNKVVVTADNIKETLSKIYSKYLPSYKLQIEDILYKQGKHNMIKRVRTNKTTLIDLIVSEEYYLTNLDLWLFAATAQLPIVLFSSGFFKNMVTGINWQILYKPAVEQPYYFIRIPIGEPDRNIPPAYHIITPALKFSDIDGFTEMVLSEENRKNQQSIDEFFQSYVIMA